MNKVDLIEKLAKNCNLKKIESEEIVDNFLKILSDSLKNGQPIKIANFGIFEPRVRKSRLTLIPGSDRKVKVPSSKTIVFKPAKKLKEHIQ